MKDGKTLGKSDEKSQIEIFADHARALLALQWERGEGFERRASTLLGFAAAALPLLLLNVAGNRASLSFVSGVLILLAVAGLTLCGLFSCLALRARTFRSPDLSQLQEAWRSFDQGTDRPHTDLLAMFTDSLIGKDRSEKATIETVSDDADDRARWYSLAVDEIGDGEAFLVEHQRLRARRRLSRERASRCSFP